MLDMIRLINRDLLTFGTEVLATHSNTRSFASSFTKLWTWCLATSAQHDYVPYQLRFTNFGIEVLATPHDNVPLS